MTNTTDEKTLYEILGVVRKATAEEIKQAFRVKAFQYHPDKNPGREEQAKELFIEMKAAYDVLIDEQKRSEYDKSLDGGEKSPKVEAWIRESRAMAAVLAVCIFNLQRFQEYSGFAKVGLAVGGAVVGARSGGLLGGIIGGMAGRALAKPAADLVVAVSESSIDKALREQINVQILRILTEFPRREARPLADLILMLEYCQKGVGTRVTPLLQKGMPILNAEIQRDYVMALIGDYYAELSRMGESLFDKTRNRQNILKVTNHRFGRDFRERVAFGYTLEGREVDAPYERPDGYWECPECFANTVDWEEKCWSCNSRRPSKDVDPWVITESDIQSNPVVARKLFELYSRRGNFKPYEERQRFHASRVGKSFLFPEALKELRKRDDIVREIKILQEKRDHILAVWYEA
jgi:DnaJ-domain-containing protein 1